MESLRTLNKLPFSKRALPKKVIISTSLHAHPANSVLAAIFFALDAVEPYHQHFSLQNYTLQYPHAVHERVSPGLCYFIAVVCPAAVIALYTLVIDGLFSHQRPNSSVSGRRSLLGRYRLKDRLWEFNCGILGLLLSEGAAFVITGTWSPRLVNPELTVRLRDVQKCSR
ncbi:hypothetical protein LTR66_010276 [Elasticomyces elasticus]|nr:hypothetical protein LTR66_010276 [Elasticomyces elasticus]